MDTVGKSPLFQISEREIKAIRESANLGNIDTITENIDLVLEWFHKQQHLPRINLERQVVERILISRKGSVEQTKQKIDFMFTIRTLIPEMAAPRDILHPDMQRQFKGVVFATMPKLNHDLTRISVYQVTKDIDNFDLSETYKFIFSTIDYRLRYDYCAGERCVCDFQNVSIGHLAKLNPIIVRNAELYVQKAYGARIAGIHYVNAPSFMGRILAIIKGVISEKLGSRLLVHPTFEDLHKHVSKSALPSDFGGDEGPLATFAEQWKQELSKEENRKLLKEQETLRSNEALRIGSRDSDDILGIPGSFKKINVD